MKTEHLELKDMDRVVELIKKEKVVAFPTDTVYGAAIRYNSNDAIKRLKRAKKRPESKPFPMMVANEKQIEEVAYINENARKLMKAFMPGALTIVFPKKESVAEEVTNGLSTIAIRMPNDPWILNVIDQVGCALLVPSANLSGEKTAVSSDDVISQLDGRISAVVLGHSKGDLSSTIVDCCGEDIRILRQGPISEEEIREALR